MSGVRDSNSIDLSSSDSDLHEKPKRRWNYKKIGIITAGAVVAVIIITVLAVVLTGDNGDETTTIDPIVSSSTTSSDTTSSITNSETSSTDETTSTDVPTSPPETTPLPTEITLDTFLSGALSPRRFNSRWISGVEVLVNDEEGLKLFNVITGENKTLLAKEEGDLLSESFTYTLSPGNTHIILGYDQVKGFRHSFEASYSVVELNPDGSASKAAATPIKIYIEDENDKLTLVQWSPNGQGLAIIYKNNIYYKPNLATEPFQVTKTGTAEIFNGIPDWVYEEEVFGSNSAMRFSPDGNKLAYIRFDDTQVDTFEYTYYGNPGDIEAQYPTNRQITYPKVGRTNPTVQLFRIDLDSKLEVEIPVPTALKDKEHIISTLSWANDDLVVATWMNREQNDAYIQICEPDLTTRVIQETTPGGWVELFTTPLYNDDGSKFALIISHDQGGDAGGYRHLTLLSTDELANKIVLTKGKYVVTQLIYWDTKENFIFYSANTEEDSRVSHIYAVKAEDGAESQCLTCNLNALGLEGKGDYKYFSASFAKDENRFGLNALGPDVPRADIYSYSVAEDVIVLVHEKEWETNDLLKQKIANLDNPFPTVEYDDEIVLNSGYKAQVSMILPGNIDQRGTTKYPVLINVYGGPDSYSVTFQWGTNWGTYLAAAKDIIYVRIDGRGSGLRGDKLMHEIYLKLGTVEIEDQIDVASKLAVKYPFIDPGRIAIWGWSYGGYAAGLALAKDDNSVFKCAVSVAPVTDWTYYDTIYTERYMGLLENNEIGYNNSRLSTLHEEFRGKNYFLIHGTLDDNVHFQQAMALSRTLETNAILFKQMSYPDEDHSLSGVQPHLYKTLERYFNDCFQLEGETTTLAPTTDEPTSPPETTPLPTEITLDTFLSGALSTRRFNSRWISGVDVLVNDKEGLKRLNVITGEYATLLAKEEGDLLSKAFTYTLSPDNTKIIIGYDQVKGFRHSFEASYSVVELNPDGSTSKAAATPIKIYIEDENDKLTLVQWSPNGQGLAIIYKNNIYYKPNLATEPFQVTKTGTAEIFNGIPDWVYEEEVFGSNSAMRFSPDGNKLAYIRFDDTQVDTFEYTYYGNPGDIEAQYPINRQITYPKVGRTNPTVQLFRIDLESEEESEVEIPVPTELKDKEHIISTLSWANDDLVVATWMNREQNDAYIQICEPDLTTKVIQETTPGGWVELFTTPLYNDDGSQFALIMSHDQGGDAGGYRHLTLLSTDVLANKIVLTKGKYVVTQLIYWDTKENFIFYSANTEEDSRVSHIYAVKAEDGAESQCLTCDLNALGLEGKGDYKYFSASFAKDENRFGLNALGPDVPRADIYSYSVAEDVIVLVYEKEWETNDLLKQKIANLDNPFPTVEYDDEIVLNSGYKAQVSIILPGNIDQTGTTKYPVLINVYGGPDSYSVTFQWGTNWGTYLAAAKDIIYVRIDGRGSGLRGDKLMHEIYLKLGTVEIEDQIEVASKLAVKYRFIDPERIAIWGWSYGGYAAGLALAKDDNSVFKCAVSVAPVTDWTYYDTIYTERYMGLLENNEIGYNNSRLSTLHEEFRGKNYFLIHGTLDDNVHFQQAMALSRTLETNAILFKQMSYPDEDHSLSGVQPHLYKTLERYFNDCFQLEGETTTLAPTTDEPTSPPETTPLPTEITLDTFLSGALSTRRFNSRWISGVDVLVNDKEGLKRLNVITGEYATLLAKEEGDLLSKAFTYTLSPDNTQIIIGYDQVKGFRHSFEASYSVVELNPDGSASKAAATPIKIYIEDENDKLTLVQWSPNGQGLAIIYKNNIYYKPNLATEPFQVTKTGTAEIFNGIPDWVYEEEVFGSNSAMRFSPDGNKLAYIRFDDTQVDTFEYTYYGNPGDIEAQYPINRQITYPKVGRTNPTVQLFRIDLESEEESEVEIPVPTELKDTEHIISTLSWANDDLVVATWMNREQNDAYIQICEPDLTTKVIQETTPGGWVELFTTPLYNDDGSQFALIMSHDQGGDAGGYRHLTLLSTDVLANKIVLTKGKYVVTQLIYWDTKENFIFYSANTEEDSRVSHIYAVKAEDGAESQCLTCDLNALGLEGKGDYKYFSASFAKDENRFGLNALGPDVPRADIYSYSVAEDVIVLVYEKEWETNDLLKQKIANLDNPFPIIEYDDEIVLNSGYKAQVSMILPGNIDQTGTTKYPVLINVYGGPDSYSVTFQWGTNWGTYLAAAKDIIYVRIDGRGSGLRGDKLMHEIYLKLGTVEIEDQIEVASKLAVKYRFIDPERIAIWGWSYGGYAAGLALAKDDNSVFKCAVSVAPVTDWTYYDTIYTERYMGLLENNEIRYNNSRLSTLHEEFRGKNYFLIHGTLDDNVHFQQAMALSRTLETNAILFKQMSYPDQDHSLSGVQPHLYNTLESYFNDCLKLEH